MKTNKLQQLLDYVNEVNGTEWTPDEIRNYSAPAETIQYYTGSAHDDKVIYNLLVELLENLSTDELLGIYREFNSYDGSFEFMDLWENDEEFFNIFFENKPMEAVRATYYGDYRFMDAYVRFNGYGNLESLSEFQVEDEAKEYIKDLADYILDNRRSTYNDDIDGFIELLEELEDEESEEE